MPKHRNDYSYKTQTTRTVAYTFKEIRTNYELVPAGKLQNMFYQATYYIFFSYDRNVSKITFATMWNSSTTVYLQQYQQKNLNS